MKKTAVDFLKKIKSIKLCLMAHPDNQINSEFADRITDLEDIESQLEKQQQGYIEEEVLAFGKSCFYKGFEKSEKDDANCYTAFREEIGGLIEQFKNK